MCHESVGFRAFQVIISFIITRPIKILNISFLFGYPTSSGTVARFFDVQGRSSCAVETLEKVANITGDLVLVRVAQSCQPASRRNPVLAESDLLAGLFVSTHRQLSNCLLLNCVLAIYYSFANYILWS